MPPAMHQESEWSSDEEPPFRNPLLASLIRGIQGSSREEHQLQLQALRHVMERHILKVRGNCGNAMDELEEVKEKGANIELRKKLLASMQELLQDSTDVCNAMLEFLKRECGANWEQREPAVAQRVCLESDDETMEKPKKERRRRPAKTWIARVHKPRNKKPPGELSEVEKDS